MSLIVLFLVGVLIGLSSDSLFMIWTSIELCTISSMPWLISDSCETTYSAVFKYFVVQAVSSIILHLGLVIMWGFWGEVCGFILASLAISLKLGGIFVGYIMSIVQNLDWLAVCVLLGLQKLPLFAVLCSLSDILGTDVMVLFGVSLGMFSIWGCVVLSLRAFIVLSSVLNISWVVCGVAVSLVCGIWYFLAYLGCFVCVCVCYFVRNLIDYESMYYSETSLTLLEGAGLCVISGLPPFVIFFGNVDIMVEMVVNEFLLESWFLIVFSVFLVYLYVNLALSSLFLGNSYGISISSGNNFVIMWVLLSVLWFVLWSVF